MRRSVLIRIVLWSIVAGSLPGDRRNVSEILREMRITFRLSPGFTHQVMSLSPEMIAVSLAAVKFCALRVTQRRTWGQLRVMSPKARHPRRMKIRRGLVHQGTGTTVHDERAGGLWAARLGTVEPVPDTPGL